MDRQVQFEITSLSDQSQKLKTLLAQLEIVQPYLVMPLSTKAKWDDLISAIFFEIRDCEKKILALDEPQSYPAGDFD